MDIRTRLLAARMSIRIENNKEYCESIGITDQTRFKTDKKRKGVKKEGSSNEK